PSSQFPDIIEVANAYPNPFNPEISFAVDAPIGLPIQVSVLDIEGMVVENIYSGRILHSGFKVYWNAAQYPSGLYLLQTRWQGGSHVQKVTFLK
ncbi:MAG: T9SS type A sorting domain-containing protein, partial [Candidatus Neomarinimicrobiota bacterium]|nr:T9SS type A sorting domain-containing protein [Candidatus Neomarinimicrobiota bacterium]